jgi:hypothetical protein
MNIADPDKRDSTEKSFEPSLEVQGMIQALQQAMSGDLDDTDQEQLIKTLQNNRSHILKYALQAYLNKPNSASLLEGVNALLGQIEKTVRDDRKERAKKRDAEGNRLVFNQMLEAMDKIAGGHVAMPSFDYTAFILDPNKPLVDVTTLSKAIKPDELKQGISICDIDGNPIDLIMEDEDE